MRRRKYHSRVDCIVDRIIDHSVGHTHCIEQLF
jgi:hypothetical protein